MSCKCDVALSNTGTSNCPSIMKIAKKLIIVAEVNAGGVNAFVTIANAKLFSAVQPYLNVATASKSRWFPTPELENVENLREDPIFQTYNSGKMTKVRNGFRTLTAFIPNGDTDLLRRLENYGCVNIGMFIVDQEDNFIYSNRGVDVPGNNAYPILVDRDTWDVQLITSTDGETQMIRIRFQFKSTEKDSNLRMIPSDELDWDRSMLYGLIDVYGDNNNCDQTELEVDVYALNGTSEKEPITGLLAANFGIYNNNTPGAVTVLAATEDPLIPGRYTLTYASQTVGHILTVSIAKNRYDSEIGLEEEVFTVA